LAFRRITLFDPNFFGLLHVVMPHEASQRASGYEDAQYQAVLVSLFGTNLL
jgi:hypothetical protein